MSFAYTCGIRRLNFYWLVCMISAVVAISGIILSGGRADAAGIENPYALTLNFWLSKLPPTPPMPESVGSGWAIRGIAGDLLVRVWGITDPASTLSEGQRNALKEQVAGQIEYILRVSKDGRWWWEGSGREGDPNVDRFVLYPFLDALYRLKAGNTFPDRIETWIEKTRPAVEFQFTHYGQRTDRDWSTQTAGDYANMDAAYMLIMGIASKLYGNQAYAESAHRFVEALKRHLLPDGGFNYISVSNEVHVYHNLVIMLLGRYLRVTGDELAREVLARTANYYPLSLVPPGVPERTSHVWWKHSDALMGNPVCPEIVAGVTGDGRNKWLAQNLIHNLSPQDAYYAVDYWRSDIEPIEPQDNLIVYDGNINGVRGRFGDFSWVGTLGVSQDAFAGAMILDSGVIPARLDSSLLLVTPEVGLGLTGPLMNRAAFISGLNYPKSLVIGDGFAALSVQYRPRRPANPPSEYPEEKWLVTQNWLFLPTNLVGIVNMVSMDDQKGRYVRVRVRTEPLGKLSELDPSSYAAGRLRVRLLMNDFPSVRIDKAIPHDYNVNVQPNADEIFLEEEPLTERPWRSYKKGQSFNVALDAHPEWCDGVRDFAQLSQGSFTGFKVSAGGRHYLVLFNGSSMPENLSYKLEGGGSSGREVKVYVSAQGTPSQPLVVKEPSGEVKVEGVPAYGTVCIVF